MTETVERREREKFSLRGSFVVLAFTAFLDFPHQKRTLASPFSISIYLLFSPDFICVVAYESDFGPLFFFSEGVAFFGGGEAALGAQAELVFGDVLGGFFYACLDVFKFLELREFGGDEAEDDLLFLDVLQRFEAACAVGVVFKEESVDVAVAEEDFSDRIVSAGGEPGGSEVAAADVHGDFHVSWFGFEGEVDHFHVVLFDLVEVEPSCFVGFSLVRIAEFAPGGVVELEVAAACFVEGADGFLVSEGDVSVEVVFVLVKVDRLVVFFTDAADEVEHARGRDGHLGHGVSCDALQIFEVFDEGVIAEADFAGDFHGSGFGLVAFEMDGPFFGLDLFYSFKVFKEVQMPVSAAEFSVGHGMETIFDFLGDKFLDFFVFDLAKFGSCDFACFQIAARFMNDLWTQEASYDVIAERRYVSCSHMDTSSQYSESIDSKNGRSRDFPLPGNSSIALNEDGSQGNREYSRLAFSQSIMIFIEIETMRFPDREVTGYRN